MRLLIPAPHKRLSSRQLSTAAENIAATQFARCGYVVGSGPRTGYLYDFGIVNSNGKMEVTVLASISGYWKLIAGSFDATATNSTLAQHQSIDTWLDRQDRQVAFCLVQFESAHTTRVPRIYLATAAEIAARLHEAVEQLGDTALYEQYEAEDDRGRHTVEMLPTKWRFSEQRVAELVADRGTPLPNFRFSGTAACVECLPMMN